MNISKILQKEQHELNQKLNQARRTLAESSKIAGNHRLKCGTSHGCTQYYIDDKYVSKKNSSLISAISEKEYLERFIPVAERMNKKLSSLLDLYEDETLAEVYNSFCKGKQQQITPFYESESAFAERWMAEEYEHWEIPPDTVSFITRRGEPVRSKSEKIIADELFFYGVPYKYEYPLVLLDGYRQVTKRPDFIALNKREQREFIIEHLGLVDKYNYVSNNFDKIGLYEKNGYLIGQNLLLFHETAEMPLNVSVVRDYIETFLL